MSLSSYEEELIEKYVEDVNYGQMTPRTVFCVVTLHGGWEVYGVSAVKDPLSFDAEIGMRIALKHALGKIDQNIDNILPIQ